MPEDTGSLCCCQPTTDPVDMPCCCDCEALDNLCDRCCRCQGMKISDIDRFFSTMEDRCRFPSCTGRGAIQVRPDLTTPAIMIPLGLIISGLSSTLMYLVFTIFAVTLLGYYRIWKRRPKRIKTRFFYSWAMTSCLTIYYVFQLIITIYREVLFWENLLCSSMFAAMMYCLYVTRRDPGIVQPIKRSNSQAKFKNTELEVKSELASASLSNGNSPVYSWDQESSNDKNEAAGNGYPKHTQIHLTSDPSIRWCDVCHFDVPSDSGHCTVCTVCVLGRDHHCIWVDNCIGQNNHRAFFLGLVLMMLCGLYGCQLMLTTVCTPEMYYDWFLIPADCRLVHNSIVTGAGYASAMYTLCSVAGLSLIFIYQVLLISQNVTSQELYHAQRHGNVYLGFFVLRNPHTRGIFRNWRMFITGRRRRVSNMRYA